LSPCEERNLVPSQAIWVSESISGRKAQQGKITAVVFFTPFGICCGVRRAQLLLRFILKINRKRDTHP
jgi:hypothetical protein